MGFRSDREALRQRVGDLEADVATRDERIEHLESELARAKQPPARAEVSRAERKLEVGWAPPTGNTEPTGDVWNIPLSPRNPLTDFLAVAWLLAAIGISIYVRLSSPDGSSGWWAPAIFLGWPALLFLYKGGVSIDRAARRVTIWRRLLVRWQWTVPLDGPKLHVQRDVKMPKDGPSVHIGHVMLGQERLVTRKGYPARELADRIAKFAGIPYDEG